MKRYDRAWLLILFVCSFYVHANGRLDVIECSLRGGASCDVYLEVERHVNEMSYRVELLNSKNGKKVFPYFDMNETTESVSLQKYGKRYVFSKYYLDSDKAIEFVSFKYENGIASSEKYYYIESSVDFNNNIKQWSGKECSTSTGKIQEGKNKLLLQVASELCVNKVKLSYIPNGYIGNDVLFYLSQVTDGVEKKQLSVIALDGKSVDAINLNDIGCLSNCGAGSNSADYIGKLNGKYRMALHLEHNNDSVSGFYFYGKMNNKIKVSGHRNGDKLMLSASVPEGIETFEGLLEEGQFKGMWSNAAGNKKYPFIFYMKLIQ